MNAQQVKQIRGRKTDIGDSVCLANICRFGPGLPQHDPACAVPPAAQGQPPAPTTGTDNSPGTAPARGTGSTRSSTPAGIRIGGVLPDVFGVNSRWQNPHGVRPAIHPG